MARCWRWRGSTCLFHALRASSLAIEENTLLEALATAVIEVVVDSLNYFGRRSCSLLQRVVENLWTGLLSAALLDSTRLCRALSLTKRLERFLELLLALGETSKDRSLVSLYAAPGALTLLAERRMPQRALILYAWRSLWSLESVLRLR